MPPTAAEGPGKRCVGVPGIIGIAIYFLIITALCLYGLIVLWPVPTASRTIPPGERTVQTARMEGATFAKSEHAESRQSQAREPEPARIDMFGKQFELWDELRLFLIVLFAGALGSLVHAIRSLYWYVGNRELIWSWVCKYMLQPFGGASLALVFYFVIRGGFFSPNAGFEHTSPFGFAALAAIVGMFSEQAVLKLREVAETMLSRPAPGKDAHPQAEK